MVVSTGGKTEYPLTPFHVTFLSLITAGWGWELSFPLGPSEIISRGMEMLPASLMWEMEDQLPAWSLEHH